VDTDKRLNYTPGMDNRRSKLAIRTLLLVLLFAMQALCHAHAIDHHFDGDASACAVCSLSGSLHDAVAADAGTASTPDTVFILIRQCNTSQPSGTTARPCARAPPLSI
jgi:hypothetical protein